MKHETDKLFSSPNRVLTYRARYPSGMLWIVVKEGDAFVIGEASLAAGFRSVKGSFDTLDEARRYVRKLSENSNRKEIV